MVGRGPRAVALELKHDAELLCFHELLDAANRGVTPRVVSNLEYHSRAIAGADGPTCISYGERERLLDEDVLACLRHALDQIGMGRVGCRQEDAFDHRVLEQRLHAGRRFARMLAGEGLPPVGRPREACNDLSPAASLRRVSKDAAPPSHANEPEPNPVRHSALRSSGSVISMGKAAFWT